MKDVRFTITLNREIAPAVYRLELASGDGLVVGGEFVNLEIDGFYLGRPRSICACGPGRITLV